MFRFRIASKTIVCLLAALMPLQGLPSTSCCCAAEAKQATDTSESHTTCCCNSSARPAVSPVATHSCCQQADSDGKRTSCSCGAGCQCEQSDSSPQPKQFPTDNRSRTSDQVVQPLVTFSPECGDPEATESDGRRAVSVSAPNRCVLLCRFRL